MRHEIGNAHDATLSNQSRQHVSAAGFLEQNKSQDSLPYTILSYPGRSSDVQPVCKLDEVDITLPYWILFY
jgi:hypothetical protein